MRCWRGLGVGLAAVACPGDATDQVNGLSLLLLIVEEAEVLAAGWVLADRGTAGEGAYCWQAAQEGTIGLLCSSPRAERASFQFLVSSSPVGGDEARAERVRRRLANEGNRSGGRPSPRSQDLVRSMALRFYGPGGDFAARMSGSFVIPLGAKRMCANFET